MQEYSSDAQGFDGSSANGNEEELLLNISSLKSRINSLERELMQTQHEKA